MIEKRKFHRVQLSSRTILSQQEGIHHGQLMNISMNGALVRLEFGTYIPKGNEYDLTIYIEGEDFPLQFKAKVVSTTFAMAGVKFVSYADDTETRLEDLLKKLS
jgi:PilZ domain